ncbi:hypothetical protein SAMN05660742_12310 [Propionispira arboris]|uniref:Uncharacterized protein n=1 Tax=Propionispira arboris TaxID=84035 RepID=A0A1H7CV52_9FIRM|nr:hypothetical protein [Propionispira arboris]SEJ90620.1 hypothetical protein SAMN05660742_12310 [Propionispira arboris]
MKKIFIKLFSILLCTTILSFISNTPLFAAADTTPTTATAASTKHAYIPGKTRIVLALLNTIDSKTAHTGDIINFKTLDNVKINGVIVIPAGTIANGKITKAVSAGSFGKGGKLEFSVTSIKTLNDIDVPLLCNASYVGTKQIQSSSGISAVGSAVQNLFSGGNNVQCLMGMSIDSIVTTDTDLNISISDLSSTMQTFKEHDVNITL